LAAPKEIVDLVDRFENNLASYKSGHYNETQVRREFVDPFFKALGWDVDNEQGFAEAYKDVIHEDAVKVGTTTKAPDYSFRIGGQRKFFLEAKKPSVDLKDDIHPAFQLRRYAWTMKLPLSVLTDFEEFAVYDCNVKPDKTDKASNARIFYLNYKDYLTRWDEIAGIFSKNAVLKGSFDKYAADKKSKRGTSAVDVVFLEEIAGWREILARNIALRNPDLSTKDLNYAVQAIVNRIVFLRICEDRGIERLMKLQDLLNGERVYPRLCELFRRADERYNSGIFHFEKEPGRESPDTLTLSLNIDDKPLKEIFKRLYYPDSPYEFSVLPAEILGQVYEQFLGKVIRLTEGHRAVIEDKPEVKKAGGVKYTPVYIVENIVGNTLGKILKGKTPLEVVLITVLDPACGSGSFLIVAYQYLLDWHRDWYVQNLVPLLQSGLKPSSPEIRRLLPGVETGKKGRKKEPELPVYQGRGGEWRLTTAERKRILLNNIYGVDIDRQAVEVTKLSLLLKVLEGENDETISKQLKLFQERALPDLSNNIKCGNSLIGWDILKDNPGLTQEEIERINPLDWEKEFPEIFQRGGFCIVIGNPPWGALLSQEDERYLETAAHYLVAQGRSIDTYSLFIERALGLLKNGGLMGYITPDTFLRKSDHLPTRELLLKNTRILKLLELGPVFRTVPDTWCSIFIIEKSLPNEETKIIHKKLSRFIVSAIDRLNMFAKGEWYSETEMHQSYWLQNYQMIIGYLASEACQKLISKMESHKRLGELKGTYIISRGEEGSKFALNGAENGDLFMVIPANVERYRISDGLNILSSMITSNKIISFYTHPKIWITRIQKMRWKQRIVSGFDQRKNSAGMKTLQIIISKLDNTQDLKYLQAILSSKLINFWCVNYLADDMNKTYLENVPIPAPVIDLKHSALYNDLVSNVDKMQDLKNQLAEAKISQDTNILQRQIEATDNQIDTLVYELYGLTEEEIKIVESV
jgi:type I restriction-modification system DNA methylase subunit